MILISYKCVYILSLFSIQNLGSGSDFAPFVTKAGVTAVDIAYNYDRSLGLSSYPMYHSAYETFRLVETYYDPTFAVCINHFCVCACVL